MNTNTMPAGAILQGKAYRYELIKVLGQGTFGITYLASVKMSGDLGDIDAYVAVKEFFMSDINGRDNLSVTASSKDGIFDKYKRKFVKEAQSLGRLQHPGIVKVLEEFEANNTVYYAMSFIDGGSLDSYISDKSRLTEQETLALTRQILDALDHMHSHSMLHLDLKPSNIMMHAGNPVLIDFGLSKQYDNDGRPESSTTVGGGTPGYSPIEQTNYTGELKNAKSLPVYMDMYALGATMFNMLTGEHPPMAADVLNYGFPDERLARLGVSEHTRGIVRKLMSPLWQDRPASDDEVRSMLDDTSCISESFTQQHGAADATGGEGTVVSPSRSPAVGSQPKSRRKLAAVWIIVVTAVLIAVAALVMFLMRPNGRTVAVEDIILDSVTDSIAADTTVQPSGPDIQYKIKKSDEICDPNAQLCAVIEGEEMVIGSINYIFGNENNANMAIFAQEDFNGDGVKEALVYDSNIGSGGGSSWVFITYTGDKSFEKSNVFSEASYYEPVLTEVDGQKVLDFVSVDMGQKIVKERHCLRNGNAVSLDLPKSRTQAYTPIKSVKMDDLGEDGCFYFDINDDGKTERIATTGSYHFFREFEMTMNSRTYSFQLYSMWGSGTLYILKSKTRGMHDLMVEMDNRYIYKWDGSTYNSPDDT